MVAIFHGKQEIKGSIPGPEENSWNYKYLTIKKETRKMYYAFIDCTLKYTSSNSSVLKVGLNFRIPEKKNISINSNAVTALCNIKHGEIKDDVHRQKQKHLIAM